MGHDAPGPLTGPGLGYTDLPVTHLVDTVAFCDPAGRKRMELKRVRARAAIVVVAQDVIGRIFVLLTWADRASGSQIADHIFRVQEAHRPRVFGIEANAMQTLFGDMVAREAQMKARRLPLLPVVQPTNVDKDWRIRTALQPIIGWDRLFLQPEQYELRTELTTFPMNPLKDLVDALASAVTLLRKATAPVKRRDDHEAFLAYLRASGAPPSYIEEQARLGPNVTANSLDALAPPPYRSG